MRRLEAKSDNGRPRGDRGRDRGWPPAPAVMGVALGLLAVSCSGASVPGLDMPVNSRGEVGGADGGPAPDGAAGATGADGGVRGDGGGALGTWGGSLCTPGRYLVCEGFESTPAGSNTAPAGWTRTGEVDVIADTIDVYRGAHAMRVNAAASGPRRITLSPTALAALGGSHWGRIFYKVQSPAPRPATGVIHSTLVSGTAMSPIAGTIEVRVVDTVENSEGKHSFLYNVQPAPGRDQFDKASGYDWSYDGNWHCAEWHVDYPTQSYHYYFDGSEVTSIAISNGAGNFSNAEIPLVFTGLSVGWTNYQTATPGFVAWFDEIALDVNRVGCGG